MKRKGKKLVRNYEKIIKINEEERKKMNNYYNSKLEKIIKINEEYRLNIENLNKKIKELENKFNNNNNQNEQNINQINQSNINNNSKDLMNSNIFPVNIDLINIF